MMKSKGIVSLILTFVGVPALTIAGLFGWQAFHQNRQPLIAKRGEAAYSVPAIPVKEPCIARFGKQLFLYLPPNARIKLTLSKPLNPNKKLMADQVTPEFQGVVQMVEKGPAFTSDWKVSGPFRIEDVTDTYVIVRPWTKEVGLEGDLSFNQGKERCELNLLVSGDPFWDTHLVVDPLPASRKVPSHGTFGLTLAEWSR